MSIEALSNAVELESENLSEKTSKSSDWEARLAVARAKRKKVLEAQAAEPKAPCAKKAPFLLSNVDVESETASFLFDKIDSKPTHPRTDPNPVPPASQPVAKAPPVTETPDPVPLATATLPEADSVEAKPANLNRLGFIAVASFTGLGFGFALGVGLLLGAGWVSPQHFSKTAVAPVEPTPVVAKLPDLPKPVVSTTNIDTPIVASASTDTPVVIKPAIAAMEPLPVTPAVALPTIAIPPAIMTRVSANPAGADIGPIIATGLTVAEPLQSVSAVSGVQDIAWVDRLTIDPHAQLAALAANDTGLKIALFQSSTQNNPASILQAYTPAQIVGADQTAWAQPTAPASVELASLGAGYYDTPPLLPSEIAFATPMVQTPQLSAPTVATAPFMTYATVPAPEWPGVEVPSVAYVPELPVELTFAQTLGLSAEAAKTFSLTLLAPEKVAESDMAQYSATLTETGLPLAKSQKVGFNISKPHIRFYSGQSQQVATALAETLGIEARNFVSTGRNTTGIEVWMAGRATVQAAKPKKVAPRRATPASPAQVRTQLSNRIISGLRNATKE